MALPETDRSTLLPDETSLVKIFNHKKAYKEKDSVFETGTQLVDITEARQLYGRVNSERRAIYPSEANLRTIQSTQTSQSIYVLDFVANAFKDMRGYLRRAALSKRVNYEKSLIFNLQPARGWTSPQSSFFGVMDMAYVSFYNSHIRKNNVNESIVDFSSFMKVFMKFATSAASQFQIPMTFTGFLGHGACSPQSSGLIIDLYEFDNNNDVVKNQLFLRDEFFPLLKETAKKFGFVIDKNIPWRLIADLSSMPMKKYMYESGLTYKTVFNDYYYQSIDYDIDLLKQYTIGFYNTLVGADPIIRKTRYCGRQNKTLSTLIERTAVTQESLDKKHDISYWADKYLKLRAAETKSKLQQNDYDIAKKNIFRMSRIVDNRRIMVYIDNLVQRNTGMEINVFKQDGWQDFVYTPAPPAKITLPAVEYSLQTATESPVETEPVTEAEIVDTQGQAAGAATGATTETATDAGGPAAPQGTFNY